LCCQFFTSRKQLKTHLLQHLKRGAYCFYCEYKVCSQHTETDLTAVDLCEFDPDSQPITTEEEDYWSTYLINRMRSRRSYQAGCPMCEVHTLYADIRQKDPNETQPMHILQKQLCSRMQQRVRALLTRPELLDQDTTSAPSERKQLSHIFSHLYYSPFQCKICWNQKHSHAITCDRVLQHAKAEHCVDKPDGVSYDDLVKFVQFPTLVQFVNFYAALYKQQWSLDETLHWSSLPDDSVEQTLNATMKALDLQPATSSVSNESESPAEHGEMESDELSGSERSDQSKCALQPVSQQTEADSDSDSCSIDFSKFRDINHLSVILTNEGYQIPMGWFQCTGIVKEVRVEPVDWEQYPELFESPPKLNNHNARKSIGSISWIGCKMNDYKRLNEGPIPNNLTREEVDELRIQIDPYYEIPDQLLNYYCPGCSHLHSSERSLCNCLKIDMKYLPISCRLCKKSTPDLLTMSVHFFDAHPNESTLRIDLQIDPLIEKWLDTTISRQRHSINNSNQILRNLDQNCLCCSLVPKTEQTRNLHLYSYKKEYFDVEHIFDHIRYAPYKCKLCPGKNPHYFSCPGRNAFRHFKNHHQRRLTSIEMEKNLELVSPIDRVERMVKQSIDEIYAEMSEDERYCCNYNDSLFEMLRSSVMHNEKSCKDAPKEALKESTKDASKETLPGTIKKRKRTSTILPESASKSNRGVKSKSKASNMAIKSSSKGAAGIAKVNGSAVKTSHKKVK
jgi:hypothetical protein